MRLLQATALFFEFLVGHAQLFLLGLQFLALSLGFFQQGHQLRAQQCGAQCQADVLAAACQQFFFARAGGAWVGHAPELDDADHPVVGGDRRQQQLLAAALAQPGGNLQMTGVHAADATHCATLQHLAELAGSGWQRLRQIGRQRRTTGESQTVALDAIERTDLRIQRLTQCAHRGVGQLLRRLIAAQTGLDRVFCLLQPQCEFGLPACADRLHHHQRHRQERHAANAAIDRGKTRIRARWRKLKTNRQQDTRQHAHDERHLRAVLKHRHAYCYEVGQPHRITQRSHQFHAQRSRHQGPRDDPNPAVACGRDGLHKVRGPNWKGSHGSR